MLDSGIDAKHPHFAAGNVDDKLSQTFVGGSATEDSYGHGTHVAGIIAGGWKADPPQAVVATEMLIEGTDQTEIKLEELGTISGIAPKATLVSYKVLDDTGKGKTSAVLIAIEQIQQVNQNGRRIRIHGANLSLGYDFNPRWFACGQSPLCVEVDRLVRSGVVVVVAAGNSGFSALNLTTQNTTELGYRHMSINDPGNAELAITVGSTHRDMPHTYGVSFFSSRGPTGDGRLKPDLVAPGERIVSCAAGTFLDRMRDARRPPAPRCLPGAERNQHGRAARVGRDSGVPLRAPGVHRPAREGQGALPREHHRPQSRARIPGVWDARPPQSPASRLAPSRGAPWKQFTDSTSRPSTSIATAT